MIKLYQYLPAFGLPNASPFCMKVETYMRMAGLPCESPSSADFRNSPKGKLPYFDDKAFFLGNEPASVDAIAYAFLANLLWIPIDLPMRAHAVKLPNLQAYCERMKARFEPA